MTSIDKLAAPTDSRRRPDQLALEYGDVDDAEELKKIVEEKQRARRGDGTTVKPMWFSQEGEGWKFRGKYCEWSKLRDKHTMRGHIADALCSTVETREKKEFIDLDIF